MAPRRVMICDDHSDYRFLVREALPHVDLSEAANARQCLDRVIDARPDVVLLDLNLPGMDGFELLPRIRELVPDARIVVLSTGHPTDVERRVMDLGATGFVRKPMRILELGDRIAEVLGDPV